MCCPIIFFFFYSSGHLRDLHSFPTRRSSDLSVLVGLVAQRADSLELAFLHQLRHVDDQLRLVHLVRQLGDDDLRLARDRKSTRLNSSHQIISYAVFCLKKKKNTTRPTTTSSY